MENEMLEFKIQRFLKEKSHQFPEIGLAPTLDSLRRQKSFTERIQLKLITT